MDDRVVIKSAFRHRGNVGEPLRFVRYIHSPTKKAPRKSGGLFDLFEGQV